MARPETNKTDNNLSRRRVLKAGTLGIASLVAGCKVGSRRFFAQPVKSSRGPNVLLIITDQQHQQTVSAGRCKYANTPALDRLCRQGVAFTNCYSANPPCSPAKSSIFTGRMPSESGVYNNAIAISSSIPNLGQWLREKCDYETIYTGKWQKCYSKNNLKLPDAGLFGYQQYRCVVN